tara:strand:- start:975 stop:1286 length:312 start_codon:yes stop_codon:yes gene_type:complete
MIELSLFFSVVINILFIWYITQLLRRFLSFQEGLDAFALKLEEYETHVEVVNSLERFYGDETLGNLLRHSKAIAKESKQFIAVLGEEDEQEDEDEEEEYGEEA